MTKQLPSSKVKRLTIQGLLAGSVVGLGIAGVMTHVEQRGIVVAAQDESRVDSTALSMVTHSHVEQIRQSSGLSNEDLAALDMGETEATAVLTRLAEWCKANEQAFSEAQQAIQRSKNEVRNHQRRARIGQADQQEIAEGDKKIEQLAEAYTTHKKLVESGAVHAMHAAPGKAAAWNRANELKGRASLEIRYLQDLNHQRLTTLDDESKRQGVSLEKVLSRSEMQDLSNVRYRIRTRMPAIRLAEIAALPLPEEMRSIEEDMQAAYSADSNSQE